MNSKWQINRVGLIDFWYYDEEEFYFLDGRMLLRGANGSGKSVTMQSFIPLLLDGNLRPERLDPFGSRARKMENYLLEEGDGREERTGYLYMELKRKENAEYLTLGIGMRARRNKKLDSWYFCITDGRRVGKEILLYRDSVSKITCSMRELRNRIGDGGKVLETQGEYAACVNKLLFGFETQEEYKELLELLIQLRTPKLSKDFKPTVINEILSSSLQTLSEDDLRPMSEAIENMDSMKTNLDALNESIRAAEQIDKVYRQYNEIVLYDKALLFIKAAKKYAEFQKKQTELDREIQECIQNREREEMHYEKLKNEEKVLKEEKESLSDSDAARLKEQEVRLKSELKEQERAVSEKERQEKEKGEKRTEAEYKKKEQEEKSALIWKEIEDCLETMEEEIEEIPFDDFAFMKTELCSKREESYSFDSHAQLLQSYTDRVEEGKNILIEEKNCEEKYSRLLQELDEYQEEREGAEREMRQYENLLHETKQEQIEQIFRWDKENEEFHPGAEILQEISRRIENYDADTDYWEVKNLMKEGFDNIQKSLFLQESELNGERNGLRKNYEELSAELAGWKERKEPEPDRSEAVTENRKRLKEKGIPFLPFYKAVEFEAGFKEADRGKLEEALLHMGILDALIIAPEYRQQVLSMESGTCDRYIFCDAQHVTRNLMELLDIENAQNDILLYQNVSAVLKAVGWNTDDEDEAQGEKEKSRGGSWIDGEGRYGMGIVEGTVTKAYTPCFIGSTAREKYRLRMIEELEETCRQMEASLQDLERQTESLQNRRKQLEVEWERFPGDQDVKLAFREWEKAESRIEALNEKIQKQKDLVDRERKVLDEIRIQMRSVCQKAYLTPRLDVFTEALKALRSYQEELTALRIRHGSYVDGMKALRVQEAYIEEVEADLDDIRYEKGTLLRRQNELKERLESVTRQLMLTDYEKIQKRLDDCLKRLSELPGEIEQSVKTSTEFTEKERQAREERLENQMSLGSAKKRRDWLEGAFSEEYRLDYVEKGVTPDEVQEQAKKVCDVLAGKFGNKKQSDLQGSLQEVYHKNRGWLLEYQITLKTLFEELDMDSDFDEMSMKRIDISAKYRGVPVKFTELLAKMKEDADIQRHLLSEKDRELFEDILANTISKKIRSRIQASKRWVDKMNGLMGSMQTSSGLTLSLRWKNKRAEREEQLDTKALVDILQKDAEIMRPEEAQQLSRHFRSKIEEARKTAGEAGNVQSFHAVMREILDYRQWFEFQLECQKTGEKKKELTDRVFFTFSGGEKAMAMYVPLFSAVVAKYAGARPDAPRLISLDEAFAGVDEMNIRDMFRLMVEFEFNFMINSQILWGDYDTVPGLAIYQLVRPENAKFVTVIRYIWNGTRKNMVTEKEFHQD